MEAVAAVLGAPAAVVVAADISGLGPRCLSRPSRGGPSPLGWPPGGKKRALRGGVG